MQRAPPRTALGSRSASGRDSGPISRGQVDDALDNAYGYELVVFAGFTATAEVQSFLGKGKAGRYKVVLLEANADLLVADLLKNTKASQTFRLFAAPDVAAHNHPDGGVYVEFEEWTCTTLARARRPPAPQRHRCLVPGPRLRRRGLPREPGVPPQDEGLGGAGPGLKGTLDEEALARLAEFQSNPFTPGEHRRAAVRVIDDSGQTSEAVISLDVLTRPVAAILRWLPSPIRSVMRRAAWTVGGAHSRR